MPSSHRHHGSTLPFPSFLRPILTVRNEHLHLKSTRKSEIEIPNLNSFNEQIFSRFHALSEMNNDEFLSLSWMLKLLDAFDHCLDDFRVITSDNRRVLSKSPADKLATQYFERSVKAMDIFNAARDGVETIRTWQKHMEIIVCAFDTKKKWIGEGQFHRVRRVLMDLALAMAHEKDSAGSIFSNRNRSFAQKGKENQHHGHGSSSSGGHSRSLSWSVSHSWSASKQLQSIASSLIPPRANEVAATNGFVLLVFSISFVLMFVLWVVVAAIPCQDRGSLVHISIPRSFSWSTPLFAIHSRIVDESKRKDRRNSCGLLKEIHVMEKCVNQMTDLVDAVQFPMSEEVKGELRSKVHELSSICDFCNDGLDPLERKLRETFRKVVICRNEGFGLFVKATEP